ncbi:MAG TPA: carboxypeptidase regulatory-like domain-containing protein, partial [Candidatus Cloacimonadota bacterium]|nr:carboxypeptidase regulatory-like domain-containing protein [Candidatus Cloacimonadota bacterium]
YTQNWEGVTAPVLPFDWTSIVQATVTSASVNTYSTTATYAHSVPMVARLQNSTDANAVVMLVGPPFAATIATNTVRVKFWSRSSGTGYPISVGVMTNPTDPATFVEVQSIALTTTVTEYVVDLTTYTGTGTYVAFKHGLGGTSRTLYVDDITFEQIAPNDLAATSITGNATPTMNSVSNYTVNLRNWGTASQSTYTVNLMSGDTVLASVPGTTLAAGATGSVIVPWTPTAEGPITIFGKVVLAGDINPANDATSPITVAVQPAGAIVVTVGEGNEVEGIPFDFYYKNSIHEALYYPADFTGVMGSITALTFYNNFVSDLQNMPIKIWLGTTQLADLSGGWILPDQLTQVYNGTINLPAGQNSIVVPLQTPYLYTGGNLVLYANRPWDTVYYNSNDNFQTQTIGTNRGRKLTSDSVEYDPMAPSAAGTLSGKFAKTSFTFVVNDMGSMSGTITSGGNPLEGVLVEVAETPFSQTTSTTGQYSFPFLQVGNYSVTASKLGYNTQTLPVTIIDGQNTVLNFNMVASANVTVTGTVYGSDQPTVGLVGAEVTLDGPLDFEGTTNASGQFTIPGVLSGNTYNYTIVKLGYQDLTGTITVGTTNYNMGSLTMPEIALPPVNVVAT